MSNAYNEVNDLKEFFLAGGLIVKGDPECWESSFDFQSKLDQAAGLFENATGRVFYAQQKTRSYDINGSLVFGLRDDLLSSGHDASVQNPVVTLNGNPLTEDTHYWLQPYNAPQDGEPYTLLELSTAYLNLLATPGFLQKKALQITGSWGAMATPDTIVKQSILAKAAAMAVPQLSTAISHGLMSWSAVDGRRQEYAHYNDQIPLSAERRMWLYDYGDGVGKYLRVEQF